MKKELKAIIAATATMYDKKLLPEVMELYCSALKDLTPEQLQKAISRHVNDPERGQFMPKPADIRRQLQGSRDSQALKAFTKLVDAVERHGVYATVCFDDASLDCVVRDMGGWVSICNSSLDEWVQKEFVTRYLGYLETGASHPGLLRGLHDKNNLQAGFKPQEVIMVGDQEKARKALEGRPDPFSKEGARRFLEEVKKRAK